MRDPGLEAVAVRALEQVTDFAAILDGVGNVVYANPFALTLLDWEEADILGTSIADHLHPEDLDRALSVLGRIHDDGLATLPVTPAFYRLRRKDGTWLRVELNATLVADDGPAGDHIAVFGRYSGDHDLQDRVMDLLTDGARSSEAVALVPEFGRWRHGAMDYAVFCLDERGAPFATGSELLVALGGLDDRRTPWSRVADTGTDLQCEVDALDPEWAAAAHRQGLTDVWGMAVADPLHDSHAVVAFARKEQGASTDVHWYAMDVMVKALRLILLWRNQVIRLQRAASEDPLTGLANRAGFWAELDRLDGRAGPGLLAVLYVDLDGFKQVNDRHGHAVGDVVLEQVARRLHHAIRPGDHVARIGGDEFAIVANGISDTAVAEAIADRIVTTVAAPFSVAGIELSIGASVGVTITDGRHDPDQLLEQADRALYAAKAAGRGRWALAAPANRSSD